MSRECLIYFDPIKHAYTDSIGNKYVSVTTLISKYEHKFEENKWEIAEACARIGKNPNHPKYQKYKGMSAKEIVAGWEATTKSSLARGNNRHDYLENSVKLSSGFQLRKPMSSGRLYTIDDILVNHGFGVVDLSTFRKAGVDKKFPKIFKIVVALVEEGYKLYAEIGVYNLEYLISGLIDLLAVKGDEFIIVDWKTNKYPIRFEGGFYEKDNDGNVTNYKITNEVMKPPLVHLAHSNGIKYALQVSVYAHLVEFFGLKCSAIIICQILPDLYTSKHDVPSSWHGKEYVNVIRMPYLLDDVKTMIGDYVYSRERGQMQMSM